MQKERIISVDILRGLVMVIMALDHMRDYSTMYHFNPEDLTQTTIPLFFTRWITHFCAPVFMFVAGVGTGLGEIAGKSKKELSHFLWTRGVWLIILEFTIIRFAWFFDVNYYLLPLLVIWALGICMIFLAAIIYLPKKVILSIGLIMIFGHNILDQFHAGDMGIFSSVWRIFHEESVINLGSLAILVKYPLIPWIGVMAVGYVFADLYRSDAGIRQRRMLIIGTGFTLLFLIIRGINIYGDPNPWSAQSTLGKSIVSFLNATKYPPSLVYLLMTLGPSIILLSIFEKIKGPVANFLIVFGRVPMFFYILHLYLIQVFSMALGLHQGFSFKELSVAFFNFPQEFGYNLYVTYALWILLIAVLYPVCKWYMDLKKRRSHPLFSYI